MNFKADIKQSAKSIAKSMLLLVALMGFAASTARAQAPDADVTEISAVVLFPIAQSDVDINFSDNARRIESFIDALRHAETDHRQIKQITITGSASPDGGYKLNQRLAQERAENMKDFLCDRLAIADSLITVRSIGINWDDLRQNLANNDKSYSAEIVAIIDNTPEFTYNRLGKLIDSRKKQLMNLRHGRAWNWLREDTLLQSQHMASIVCLIETTGKTGPANDDNNETRDIISTDETTADETDTDANPIPAIATPKQRYTIFALRSNLLVPLLNIGAELPLGNRWSIGADYYYPWQLRKEDHKNCFQLLFGSGELRYWFGKGHSAGRDNKLNRLHGHSIAAYGAWGYYDFEHNWHGHQGHFWSAGLDYVYAMPICKDRLHLEFQIAAGIISSRSTPYNVYTEGGNAFRVPGINKKFSYIGPTKIGISLVLPINTTLK